MSFRALFSPVLLLAFVAPASIAQEDRLVIKGAVRGEQVVVMMNARASSVTGCLGNSIGWVLRSVTPTSSTGSIGLGNLAQGCVLEIAIFSEFRAMLLETGVKEWTATPGEVHTVTLRPLIRVPVSVWITDKAARARAHKDMDNAKRLYRKNKVGVRFVPTYHNVSSKREAVELIGKGIVVSDDFVNIICTNSISDLKGSPYYTAGRLNVYYVEGDFPGRNCAIKEAHPFLCDCDCAMAKPGDGEGNIVYVGRAELSNLATLAHELGHAFGLRPGACWGHTDDVDGFDSDNMMWGGGDSSRKLFSVGQAFRMNTQDDKWDGTMLIKNGLRPAKDGRKCPPDRTDDQCPTLKTKWP